MDEVAYDVIEMYPVKSASEIVTELLEKYKDREDVTEEELRLCIEDVESLVKAGKLYTEDTFADKAGTFKERSGNVIKALCTAVFILFLYTNALTYYNQNMEEYWKRSWVITVDLKSSLISLVIIVFTALLGVVFARESINKINISKTLKAGE